MGRVRARFKNVLITGVILSSTVFFWLLTVSSKQDGQYGALLEERYLELQEKLQHAELNGRQRLDDLNIMRNQFNYLVQLVSNNNTDNNSIDIFGDQFASLTAPLDNNMTEFTDISTMVRDRGGNFTDQLGTLHLPSIFTYLPHLTGHPDSLKPVYKLSNNRFGASIVLGIPTIRRDKVDYLEQTVRSLISGMTEEEQNMCLIIVFVAEPWDSQYAEQVGTQLKKEFEEHVNKGLLEVIAPPAEFYPDLDSLKLTFGDNKERVRWRTKQNLDFAFLMLYARTRGYYYVQLEDDVLAKPGYFSVMKAYADEQKETDWILLEFSSLGFIGKLFKSSDIPVIVEFFLMFHKDKPIDWLLDHFLNVKVCSPEKDKKHCARMIAEVRKRFKPSLFQHVGTQSSLKGKTQKLKDRDFGKQAIYRAHVNPKAVVYTSIKAYQKYFCKKAYIGEDIFWGLAPAAGDTFDIEFDPPIQIASFLFRSGNAEHPDDTFKDTVIEVLENGQPESKFRKVGEFDADGLATGEVDSNMGPAKRIRLKVLKESANWVILSEIHIVPQNKES